MCFPVCVLPLTSVGCSLSFSFVFLISLVISNLAGFRARSLPLSLSHSFSHPSLSPSPCLSPPLPPSLTLPVPPASRYLSPDSSPFLSLTFFPSPPSLSPSLSPLSLPLFNEVCRSKSKQKIISLHAEDSYSNDHVKQTI